ncbi:MAG TPA: thioredoxin domain-containing protein, partial [Thermoanaerobaculia bacterium]|nr:thioredoxin domain-containing protein [Thermoanaerobaculia bacterium]
MLNSHRLEVAKSLPFLAVVLLALAGGAVPVLASTAATQNVVTCSDHGFREKVLHATMPVLVDFSAPWCASCRALDESLGELATSLKGKV